MWAKREKNLSLPPALNSAIPSRGALQPTGNPPDFAINGEGYFAFRTAQGIALSALPL